ncbi:MAG TPA: hypothetical protein VGM77_06980 [Gemmatimonadales bacterium]|jgi:hypothetical protein
MPITYVVDPARRVITETWTGTIRIGDLAAYWRGYLADPAVMSCRRTLVDLNGAELDFTGSELSALIQRTIPTLEGKQWATALLVNDPVQYGTSRQYQAFADLYSKDAIFSDRTAAENWLLRQNPDDISA